MKGTTWRARRVTGAAGTLVAAALLGATAVGCSSGEEPAEGDDAAPEVVRLLTYDSFALDDEVAAAFEEASGARLEVIPAGDSGAMLAGALLSARDPGADVIFGIDNTSASKAAEADLLADHRPDAAETLPAELAAPGEVGDLLTPIDTSEVCINADEAWFEEHSQELPETFEDLVSEPYRDLLVVENPVNSSPGLAFMLGSIEVFGPEGWTDYWDSLRENGVRVAPSWDDAYYNDYTVNGGERPLVVSYASSPPAEVVFSEGARSEPASVVLDGTCVTQVEYAGLLAGAENPAGGRELLEFMLGEQWQSAVALSNFVYPVTDVELPEEFQQWAPRPDDPITLDAEAVARERDDWLETWRSVME